MAERWDQYDLVIVFKIINKAIALPMWWEFETHNYSLRNSDPLRLHKPQASSARQSHSFFHRSVNKWNVCLPNTNNQQIHSPWKFAKPHRLTLSRTSSLSTKDQLDFDNTQLIDST
eukprot:GHVN01083643.1.p1 GENE.GHVN01083643.1~~GHVN01083643.1.p1  ORF type:complete len:116 (+),score=13.80 GHVN01083643.1:519-866(+)